MTEPEQCCATCAMKESSDFGPICNACIETDRWVRDLPQWRPDAFTLTALRHRAALEQIADTPNAGWMIAREALKPAQPDTTTIYPDGERWEFKP